jgi:hypothetical protein
MIIQKLNPKFGVSYDVGWIGFTRTFDFVGGAIAYGERWERTGTIPAVNHVLIVAGNGTCVQAHCRYGVQAGQLSQYLDDPTSRVYFRKPLGWTPELGQRIANTAHAKIGCRYANGLILEQVAADTILGHFLNVISRGWIHAALSNLIAKPGEFICSTLGAFAMASQPEYKGSGILKEPLAAIDPQKLFENEIDFAPEVSDCSFRVS